MKEEQRYHQFSHPPREDLKLQAAVDGLAAEGIPEEHKLQYLEYIKGRRRPAVELLIDMGTVSSVALVVKYDLIDDEAVRTYIKRASRNGNMEVFAYLIQLQNRKSPALYSDVKTRSFSEIAADLWRLSVEKLIKERPDLKRVLRGIGFQTISEPDILGFDGNRIYYSPEYVIKRYLGEPDFLKRTVVHMVYHGILLHIPLKASGNPRIWNLACDIQVDGCLDGSNSPQSGLSLLQIYRKLEDTLASSVTSGDEVLKELEQRCQKDDHRFWTYGEEPLESRNLPLEYKRMKLYKTRKLVDHWKGKGHGVALEESGNTKRMGTRAGQRCQRITLKKKKTYDYHTFLRQFAVYGEEMSLDMDSFDYIPYWYSRNLYQDIVLLEPLEYREERRLEEFVIAIDTSGSCSGTVVQKFLEQTYAILTEGEHFFSRMSVYVIQCDSMIQEVAHITCEEEWKDYAGNLKVKGLGGTDFRPVFQFVDKKMKSGEIKNLKGMLYFTDGDGVYPSEKPDYETAFVFLNSNLKKSEVPDWALMLNLQLNLEKL